MKKVFNTERWPLAQPIRDAEQGRARAWALGVVLAFLPAITFAQAMSDPTRPPPAFAAPAAADQGPGAQPVLQSVMISPTHRAAIIDGVLIEVGGKVGNAVLVSVTDSEAVLRSGETTRVLTLYPRIEKHAPGGAPR